MFKLKYVVYYIGKERISLESEEIRGRIKFK